jgi:hypothetical protein
VVFEDSPVNVRLFNMGQVYERHPAQLIGQAGRILRPAKGVRARIPEQQGLYVLPRQYLLMSDEEGAFSSRLILSGTRWLKPFRTFLFQMIIQASR